MRTRNEVTARVAQHGFVLRSIEAAATKTSVVYEQDGLEIMMVELGATAATEPTDGSRSSWHLILEGQAVLQQGDRVWEMLPSESLALRGGASYLLRNPAPERAKLLSVLFTESAPLAEARRSMTAGQKSVVWGLGVLLWTELLSICLSAWRFGMVDWPTVGAMA
jgi:mannose-6-phosphate isomerase-like protein (cupin superfamily)